MGLEVDVNSACLNKLGQAVDLKWYEEILQPAVEIGLRKCGVTQEHAKVSAERLTAATVEKCRVALWRFIAGDACITVDDLNCLCRCLALELLWLAPLFKPMLVKFGRWPSKADTVLMLIDKILLLNFGDDMRHLSSTER